MKRDSRFMILLYAGMVLVPLFLFLYLVSAVAHLPYETLMLGLAAAFMVIFGIVGSVEIYAHGREPEERMPLIEGQKVSMGLDSERGNKKSGTRTIPA